MMMMMMMIVLIDVDVDSLLRLDVSAANPKVHHRVHKRPASATCLCHTNPVRNLTVSFVLDVF